MALAGRTPPPRSGGIPCSVSELLARLPEDESKALAGMLNDPAWTGPAIYAACVEEGYDVAKSSIQHHRRGDCACKQ